MRMPDSIGADLVRGALAGALATWVMDRVTTVIYERQDRHTRAREQAASGRPAYRVAAEKVAAAAGLSATDEQLDRLARALHWGLGIGAGVLYAVRRREAGGPSLARGLAFGFGFFLTVDEIANTAFGFSAPPAAYPWQTHARGLAGHLAFGLVAEAALALQERAA